MAETIIISEVNETILISQEPLVTRVLVSAERGLPGKDATASVYELQPTAKLPITDNKILLPSKPSGGVMHNMMLVYNLQGSVDEYDSVSIEFDGLNYYALLNEAVTVEGYGVVTYLTKVVT